MQNSRNGLLIASIAAVLTGCGGGGAASTPVATTPPVTSTPSPVEELKPILVKSTSYANAKEQGFGAIMLPIEVAGADAYAQADFKQNGTTMLFVSQLKYNVSSPVATPSVFAFYSKTATGAWVKEFSMIDTPNGCIHPRKAVVADFNNDGKPDILVACHGLDVAPFPGEENFLVLSTASGVYTSKAIPSTAGFFHSATAADFDGDGKIDFIATDSNSAGKARMFKGNGNGTFTENTVLPEVIGKNAFYTVEATDVNNDGKPDLLFGADEFTINSQSQVVLGNGTGNFTTSIVIGLAKDPLNQTVLDFVVKNGVIYELRTASDKENFYKTKSIMKVDLANPLAGTTIFQANGQGWAKWLLPTATGLISDDVQNPASASF